MSPDKTILIAWDSTGRIFFYNSTIFTLLFTYIPTNPPNSQITDNIHFNSDGTLIAIESDTYNPLIIFDLTNFSIKQTINIGEEILDVVFLDGTNSFLHVLGSVQNYVIDLSLSTNIPENETISSSIRVSDGNNKLYTCCNNQIN